MSNFWKLCISSFVVALLTAGITHIGLSIYIAEETFEEVLSGFTLYGSVIVVVACSAIAYITAKVVEEDMP